MLLDLQVLNEIIYSNIIADSKRDYDLLKGDVDPRSIAETCINDLYACATNFKGKEYKVSEKLAFLVGDGGGRQSNCPGLVAFITVAAEDNGEIAFEVLKRARSLYSDLSEEVHGSDIKGKYPFPVERFESISDKNTKIALAALMKCTGRNMRLYNRRQLGESEPLLRLPPLSLCKATEVDVRNRPLRER